MPNQPILAARIVKRTKREIPIPLFGARPPKQISYPSALVKAAQAATTNGGIPEPSSSDTPHSALAATQATEVNPSAEDPTSSPARCDVCLSKATQPFTQAAGLSTMLTELATLTSALRDVVHAASMPATLPRDLVPPEPKRKYTPRKTDQKVDPVPLTERKWITIKQAAAIYPKSEQAWRHLVHQASQYLKHPKAGLPSNGFEKCIARQPGSRNVYLIVEELDRWLANGQEGTK